MHALTMTHPIRAGNIRRPRFKKNGKGLGSRCQLSVMRYPLIEKKINTPISEIGMPHNDVTGSPSRAALCPHMTRIAAKHRTKSKLFSRCETISAIISAPPDIGLKGIDEDHVRCKPTAQR